MAVSRAIVNSLEVNVVSDLPIASGVRTTMKIYIALAAVFVFLVWGSYHDYTVEKFLSLSDEEGICEENPKDVTGVFMSDMNGYWAGDAKFEFSKAMYSFQFFHLESSEDSFYQIIEAYLSELDRVGSIMKTKNLAVTVLYWTTWMISSTELEHEVFDSMTNSHYFALTGNVGTVFNQAEQYMASLSSVSGHCNISIMTRYDKLAALYRLTIPRAEEYVANQACMDKLDIRNLGYNLRIPTPQFDFSFDANTVMACVAVNLGIISLKSLELVPHSTGFVNMTTVDGSYDRMSYGRFYHTRFPNMDTMYCFFNEDTGEAVSCSIYKYSINLMPVFNHLGFTQSAERGESPFCECDPTYSESILRDCNDYSFITGFIFYNYNPYNETMYQEAIEEDNNVLNMDLSGMYNIEGRIESDNNFFNLVMKYFDDFQSLNRDAYDSCRESAVHNVVPLDQSERDRMYKYCTEGLTQNCSVLAITSYSTGEVTSVSPDYYQIPWGHCNDTISISDTARAKLYTPPIRLTEVYYECKKTKLDSLITAVGISSATALSLKVAFIIVVTMVMSKNSTVIKKKSSTYKTYGIDERREALHYLAHNLLLARDGHYGQINSNDEAVVQSLAEELSKDRFIKRFFPVANKCTSNGTDINPMHDNGGQDGFHDSTMNTPRMRDQNMSVSEMVHRRKLAAFQEELLANPFSISKDKNVSGTK